MAGFSQGGGVGLALAEWMVEGEPSRDVFAMDVARFGDWCTRPYTRAKVRENYQRRFAIGYPNEELPAGRPLVTTPAYGAWQAQNAVFGAGYGLEHVNYFAPPASPPSRFRPSAARTPSSRSRRSARRCAARSGSTRSTTSASTGSKGRKRRAGCRASWRGGCRRSGRIALTPMLSPRGKLIGDFTIARLGAERFHLTASYAAQAFHMRWFLRHLPPDGMQIENVSLSRLGFQIAGPRARELLARVAAADVSNAALPFLSVIETEIGLVPATVCRVTYTGDLGYEIYVEAQHQLALYHALAEAGRDLELRPFGMRAMMALRLEKLFGAWGREYRPDYTPAETGLDRFVRYEKNDFIGRDAAARERDEPPARRLCGLAVDAADADPWADEPIWHMGKVVGFVTSGGYAHHSSLSIALGMLPRELIDPGNAFEVEILGERRTARLLEEPPLDPRGARMRG